MPPPQQPLGDLFVNSGSEVAPWRQYWAIRFRWISCLAIATCFAVAGVVFAVERLSDQFPNFGPIVGFGYQSPKPANSVAVISQDSDGDQAFTPDNAGVADRLTGLHHRARQNYALFDERVLAWQSSPMWAPQVSVEELTNPLDEEFSVQSFGTRPVGSLAWEQRFTPRNTAVLTSLLETPSKHAARNGELNIDVPLPRPSLRDPGDANSEFRPDTAVVADAAPIPAPWPHLRNLEAEAPIGLDAEMGKSREQDLPADELAALSYVVPMPPLRRATRPAPSSENTTASLAYAASPKTSEIEKPSEGIFQNLFGRSGSSRLPSLGSGIAVYDIASATVYLPNGERLEAHSGLSHMQDNPKYVHVKNRGPTPPDIYDLVLRESPFHGVEAIRLLPSDGRKKYNRDGLLAHTYMYVGGGEHSQSNGCVVFKDYDRFLRAFKRGEIKRLIVAPSLRELPTYMAAL